MPPQPDSDIIVITAGLPRKPGMSRDDLLFANAEIVRKATEETIKHSPDAIYVILTNPLDVMAYLAMKVAGSRAAPGGRAGWHPRFGPHARLCRRWSWASASKISPAMSWAGMAMIWCRSPALSNVAGIPLEEILPADRLAAIVDRTRKGGGEIVNLLKTGSAYYAPAVAIAQMVDAILKDKHLIVPCAAYLQGEYGLKDIFFGVPTQLGRQGVEKVIEYKLSEPEMDALQKSAAGVVESIAKLKF